ncbi:hypothetical protein [Pseudomonas sp. TWI929]|uniref:hypothetical protein n=1 Tax=Pseudomonas sp. TWI929 TaxID=3136795 RepID=UPI003207FCFA
MADEANRPLSAWGKVQSGVAVLSAIIGVVSAYQALQSKSAADASADKAMQAKMVLETQANERAEKETRVRLDAIAYEAVVKVLELDRATVPSTLAEKRERAVLALVLVTASDQMRQPLIEVLGAGEGVSASVKTEAKQASDVLKFVGSLARDNNEVYAATEPQAPTATPGVAINAETGRLLKGYRVVIFSCQTANNRQMEEAQVAAARTLLEELNSNAEIRPLNIVWSTKVVPELLNSAPGYSIQTNQIRFNPDDSEDAPSLALKAALEAMPTAKANGISFERRAVSQRTPGYLSVFLCGVRPEGSNAQAAIE